MKYIPIPFTGSMLRAILAGTKTQTRRLPTAAEAETFDFLGGGDDGDEPGVTLTWGRCTHDNGKQGREQWLASCAEYPEEGCIEVGSRYGNVGDRLWVREAWRTVLEADGTKPRDTDAAYRFWYEADAHAGHFHQPGYGKLRPGMFMPRWASRITLEVTGVRVERLQAISEADAIAEGIERTHCGNLWRTYYPHCVQHWNTDAELGHKLAKDSYASLWESINGPGSWAANPWVWVVEFKRIEPRIATPHCGHATERAVGAQANGVTA